MSKHKKALKTWAEYYDEIDQFAAGGNAIIYHVKSRQNGKIYVLKELKHVDREKVLRLKHELKIVTQYQDTIPGILPILQFDEENNWYTMPEAKPVDQYIRTNNSDIPSIVRIIISYGETLSELHKLEITHRDIKPDNLYVMNHSCYIGDFGLVDFPDNTDNLTESARQLGAKFTMAPEMRRDPQTADGKPADVYSLAKTLWILLTGVAKGFDGVYNFTDPSHGLHNFKPLNSFHLVELEEMLTAATQEAPEARPTMPEFVAGLCNWLQILNNYEAAQASDWNFLKKHLFGPVVPKVTMWTGLDNIVHVLRTVVSIPAYNHMMLPEGGGADLHHVYAATENYCIRLIDDSGIKIVKPNRLYFVSFENNIRWNYFYLETSALKPILGDVFESSEDLIEDIPGHYVSAQYANYGVYDYDSGIPLPDGAEVVSRYCNGNFLIVLKSSPYNHISSTYDGRHSDVDFSKFYDYMNSLVQCYKNFRDRGFDEHVILNSLHFTANPFECEPPQFRSHTDYQSEDLSMKFISENYKTWTFSDFLPPSDSFEDGNAMFYIEFHPTNESDFSDIFDKSVIVIGQDGALIKIHPSEIPTSAYTSFHRNICSQLIDNCIKYIKECLARNGLEIFSNISNFFSIGIIKIKNPTHFFTKADILSLLKDADDRQYNLLVIDENGYPQLLQDSNNAASYPVRLEGWGAYGNYVGKYSHFNHLDDSYICLLEGWLNYLQFGKHQFIDCALSGLTEEELISKIRTILNCI